MPQEAFTFIITRENGKYNFGYCLIENDFNGNISTVHCILRFVYLFLLHIDNDFSKRQDKLKVVKRKSQIQMFSYLDWLKSKNVRDVLCRIRLLPRLISKREWLPSRLPLTNRSVIYNLPVTKLFFNLRFESSVFCFKLSIVDRDRFEIVSNFIFRAPI